MNIISIIQFIKEYWVLITFLFSIFIAIYTFGKAMIEATKCSLRNDILDIYDRAEAKGNKITHYELEALTHSAEMYFKLKGNSFVKALMKKVEAFEL